MHLLYIVPVLMIVAVLAWFINTYRPARDIEARVENDLRETGVANGNMKKFANLVLLLVVIGIFLWLINTYVPMAGSIKAILNIVVVIGTCVLVLKVAGLWSEVVRMWNGLVGHRLPH